VSLILKYSNWLVAAILLLVGTRVLFVILLAVLTPDSFWRERAVASLVQATVAVLFILAAVGTVRWKPWGRSLGIAICAWNAFATIFLSRLGPKHRATGLSLCAALALLIIWFYLPRVKLQFFRTGVAQPDPPLSPG
jgi:hypothetical protein